MTLHLCLTPSPKGWNLNLHCLYHKKNGHSTNKCFRLKHDIEDLIDRDVIPKPNPPTMSNIHQNPLPNYQRVPPPNQLNYIEEEEFIFAIDDEVWMDFYKPTNGDSCHSTRTGKHFKPPYLKGEHPGREDLEREVPSLKSVKKMGKIKNISKPDKEEDRVLT